MMSENAYNASLETLYSLGRFGIKLGLSTIKGMLEGLGNPQDGFKSIHIAGTNGKGSIASTLSSVLASSGKKVGLYTSPHLIRFNERICINNRPVSDQDVVAAYQAVKTNYQGVREPTFFEYATAMAFFAFGRHQVDWAVIETGMGGRLDATNIITPVLSIISNISLEHKMYLGHTLYQIAKEKGGIIKRGIPVIAGAKQPVSISALKTIAKKRRAPFFRLGSEFRVRRRKSGIFTYYGMDHIWPDMSTGLLGNYQVDNAALTLAACEILNRDGARISLADIKKGIAGNRWPGRLEIVSRSPFILLDGAHNLMAARNLARFLLDHLSDKKITLVIGILDDKPYHAILRSLIPLCSKVILTRAKIDRAIPPETLYPIAKEIGSCVHIIPEVGDALNCAIKTASLNDAVCVAGSLYVVGEAKAMLESKEGEYFPMSG